MSHLTRIAPLATLSVLLAACGDGGTGTGTPQGAVTLSLATRPGASSALRTASLVDPLTIGDGTNTLVINSAQVVLRKIELKSSTPTCSGNDDDQGEDANDDHGGHGAEPGDDHVSGGHGSDGIRLGSVHDDSTDGGDDDCGELKLGPVLVDLPLSAGASQAFSVDVPTGTYDRVEFKIHRPTSTGDSAFVAAHPDFAGVSIKVTGTYNGTPFTFVTDLEKEQENQLVPPLTVSTSGPAELTLFLDVDKWFRAADGSLVDPATANAGQANEALVRANIGGSSDCFEDHNRDGRHDD